MKDPLAWTNKTLFRVKEMLAENERSLRSMGGFYNEEEELPVSVEGLNLGGRNCTVIRDRAEVGNNTNLIFERKVLETIKEQMRVRVLVAAKERVRLTVKEDKAKGVLFIEAELILLEDEQ